jgi:tRNA(Ile)-lysidine synthase
MSTDAAAPLDDDAFAALMTPLGPFERAPLVAAAVSGGADSLALTLLLARWARARGGSVVALTVDHGLRPEAAGEARQVAFWLAARGIAHRALAAPVPLPSHRGGLQAAARAARYALLADWCRDAGCLHLCTAHHREDQAETFLLRLGRGSGLDGLAAMAPVADLGACRLLRPLLDVPRARLAATLDREGQAWIEDPSNRDLAYARVRLRKAWPALDALGLSAGRIADAARHLRRVRAVVEAEVAALAARAVVIHPAGHALLDPVPLAAAADEVAMRLLARVLAVVGGGAYTPRLDGLERLAVALRAVVGASGGFGRGRTLARCRVVGWRDRVLVCREPAALAPPVAVPSEGAATVWDGRFRVTALPSAPSGLTVGALGSEIADIVPAALRRAVPGPARPALPALRDGAGRLLAAPHLGWRRDGETPGREARYASVVFHPSRSLTGAGFTVV